MGKSIRWFSLPIITVLVLSAVLSFACAPSKTVREAGSTSVLPLAEAMASRFMELHPKVRIETGGGGSGAGVTQCAAGTVDIGAVSRDVKPTEPDFITYPIARDAVAIVVNQANTVSDLTIEQIAEIFAGEITNWSEVGGTQGAITVYAREEGSGTRDCFEHIVMGKKTISPNAHLFNSNGGVQIAVQGDSSGIGFVSLGYISGLKALKINGVECTIANCLNDTYPLVRPFYFITKEAPAGLVKEFIDFCQSPAGQSIVEENGYVPIG